MKKEKAIDRQGKGLVRLSVFLIILAVGMLLVLFDIYFVPSGAEWEEIKQEYADESEGKTDKQLWYELRDAGRETGNLKTPSNILNWLVVKRLWNEEKQENIRHEESQRIADERAAELQEYISELASGYDIPERIKFNIILCKFGKTSKIYVSPYCYNYESDVIDECVQLADYIETELIEKYPDEAASIAAYINGGTCEAVVYAPDIKCALKEGLDFPYFDDYGNFSDEYRWGGGMTNISKNGFIIGLSPHRQNSD